MCSSSRLKRSKNKSKSKSKSKPKPRKPKYLSIRNHLAPTPQPPLVETIAMQDQENIDSQVACLLEHGNGPEGGPTITDLFTMSNNSSLVLDHEVLSPAASPSVNWDGDGLARRALRGREKWVFCKSSSSTTTSSSSISEEMDLFGGRCNRQGLLLKLDYEEVLTAWSDRGSLYIDGEGPQVVPELRQRCEDDSIVSNVFVEVGNGGVWRVPEMDVEKKEQVKDGDKGNREARVMRYKEKRQSRLFAKRIRYEVRKLNAEKRPRIKGRFVKRVEEM